MPLILPLLLSCFTPSDGEDWSSEGGWASVRPPPGYEDTYTCFVWAARGNPWVDAIGGPVCLPRRP